MTVTQFVIRLDVTYLLFDTMTVLLRPIEQNELDAFIKFSIDAYAQSMVDNGEYPDRDIPNQLSKKEVEGYFPNGKLRPSEYIFTIERQTDDQNVGTTWVTIYPDRRGFFSAFLVWIDIAEAYQRKGYAKAALAEIEKFLRKKHVLYIDLSVFANNKSAQKLYEQLGYRFTKEKTFGNALQPSRFEMRKDLVAMNVLAR